VKLVLSVFNKLILGNVYGQYASRQYLKLNGLSNSSTKSDDEFHQIKNLIQTDEKIG
jgi:hypothetical protein